MVWKQVINNVYSTYIICSSRTQCIHPHISNLTTTSPTTTTTITMRTAGCGVYPINLHQQRTQHAVHCLVPGTRAAKLTAL